MDGQVTASWNQMVRAGHAPGPGSRPEPVTLAAQTTEDDVQHVSFEVFELASEMADYCEAEGDELEAWQVRRELAGCTVGPPIELANTDLGSAIEARPAVPGSSTLFHGAHKVTRTGGKYRVTLNHAGSHPDTATYDDPDDAAQALRTGRHAAAATHNLANEVPDYGAIVEMNNTLDRSFELGNQAHEREQRRLAHDDLPSARSAEGRLASALDRIATRTYTPQGQFAIGLANTGQPGTVTGHSNCGPSDDLGHCIERYHAAGCGSTASPDVAEELRGRGFYRDIATRPYLDANGRTWADKNGTMSLSEHFEAHTGTRVRRETPFEQGAARPERPMVQRQARFGDPEDPDDRGANPSGALTRQTARIAAQMGLTPTSAARARELNRNDPRRVLGQAGRMRRMGDGDGIVTARDRADRLHQTVTSGTMRVLDEPQDGLVGALPRYTL